MQNTDLEKECLQIISNIIKADNKKLITVFQSKLVDKSLMTMVEVHDLLSGKKDLDSYPVPILVWIYNVLKEYNPDLPKVEHYFTDREINASEVFQIERTKTQYPLQFEILRKPDPYHEDYLMSIPIKTLVSLLEKGMIQLDPEIQRESEISSYNGILVSNIKFNPNAAREICDSMGNNNYRTDMIRLILVQDGEEDYKISGGKLVVNSGNIALIDGNHRLRASEMAVSKYGNIDLELVVMFTIGTIKDGKYIIAQSEKRQPLNSERLKTFESTPESSIIKGFVTSLDLDRVYKFCQTKEEFEKGVGFVLESILVDSVKKFYDMKNISKKKENAVIAWLVEFFNELADILNRDFVNYRAIKKTRWSATPYAFAGYIYLSSKFQDMSDWQTKLLSVISSIDFNKIPWKQNARNQDKVAVKIFEEVMSSVL